MTMIVRFVTSAIAFTGVLALAEEAVGQVRWEGPYAGLGVTWQAESRGEVKTIIDPGLDERLTYSLLPTTSSQIEPALEAAFAPSFFVGWRVPVGGLIAGIEGRYQEGGGNSKWTTEDVFQSNFEACGNSTLSCLVGASDRLSADVSVDRSLALRASIGLPVSDRLLISAYAGPSILWGNLSIAQTSNFTTGRRPILGVECFWTCPPYIETSSVTQTVSRTVEDKALGFVVGATADLAVTKRWLARAELGYARYEAIRGTSGGDSGANSEVRAQAAAFEATLGIAMKF